MGAEMRQKMGLSEEAAGRIIKGVQNQRLIGNLQAVKASGALTLDKVRPALTPWFPVFLCSEGCPVALRVDRHVHPWYGREALR